jgi:glycosyltransferase involved in cell wall biosynthesis
VGIVRTEREIAARLLADDTIDVVPVVFYNGAMRALDPLLAQQIIASPAATDTCSSTAPDRSLIVGPQVNTYRRSFGRSVLRWCVTILTRIAKSLAHSLVRFAPSAARNEIRQTFIHARQAVRNSLDGSSQHSIAPTNEPIPQMDFSLVVHPTKNDIVFLCGLGWDVVDCKALSRIKMSTGVQIVSVLYDMIPIKFPEFLGGQPKDYFLNYFLHMADLSTHCFCISKCTERDFLAFCQEEQRGAPSTSVVHLGANVLTMPNPGEIENKELRERLGRGRYALTVGTFEVRKNYKLLLNIWPELVKNPLFDLDLVIVGMPGWNVEEVVSSMESSPLYEERIFWFRSLSDAGLSWLYENCHVFLFPSLYEGWGLPIVESLQYHRPAIVSSRGASPEATMGSATILDPDDRSRWIAEIKRLSLMSRTETEIVVDLPSWDQAASKIRDNMRALFAREIG